MAKTKGSRAKKEEASPDRLAPPGETAGNGTSPSRVAAPGLVGQSFEVAVIGAVLGTTSNGPARIYLSPTLMMAEAIGTGDLLAVALLGPDGKPTDLTALHQQPSRGTAGDLGSFFTLAEAWPSPKLPRDATRLSPPLSDSLAHPPGGSMLRIFPLAKTDPLNTPASNDTPSKSGAKPNITQFPVRASIQTEHCSSLRLEWCPPAAVDDTKSLPLPLSPVTPDPRKVSDSPVHTPNRPRTPSGSQPPSSPQPQTPQTPQTPTPQNRQSPQTPQSARGRRAPPASPATPKGRKLPGGPASPSPSPLKRNEEEQTPQKMSEGQRAAVVALLGDPKGRGVVETFAARWLAGRHLLEGNHVVIPLCGFDCTFQVLRPIASEPATSLPLEEPTFSFHPPDPETPLPASPTSPLVAFSVGGTTKVTLLEPTESASDRETRGEEVRVPEKSDESEMGNEPEEERVGYSVLGGVGDQIKALRELVELPLKRPDMFRRYGIRPPRGVLLFGPPGTGKTLLARAAASESGASMFVINGPEIVSAHYGESEEALRDVFAAAEKAAPSVIFIDELDAIAPARDTGTEDMAQRMVAALLTLLDGRTGDFNRVIVIAATNRPDSIDSALRRPGRFDRELEIGVPTPKARLEILHTLLRGKRHSLRPADVNALAAATHGFVGADLAALCNEAALNALRRIVRARAPCRLVGDSEVADVVTGDVTSKENLEGGKINRVRSAERKAENGEASGKSTPGDVPEMSEVGESVVSRERGSGLGLEVASSGKSADGSMGQGETSLDVRIEIDVTARLSSLALGESDRSGESAESKNVSTALDSWSTSNPPGPNHADRLSQQPSSKPSMPAPPITTPSNTSNLSNPPDSTHASPSPDQPSSNSETPSNPPCITLTDFEAAQTKVRPSAMREVMIEVPRVRWGDIGGQQATKQKLQETVEWPQKHPEAFARVGAQAPRGVLLYGPPGCSKTLMARAVATEAGLNFLAVKGPELFSKWVGESEKAVRALFARARASAPSVIFFDEIDGLAATRDDGSTDGGTGVSERVMSQLLTELDGLSPLAGVAIIGATNRPDIIDPALLRPGRFDRMLFVGPPDRAARAQIFGICLRKTPCGADVRIESLAGRTEKYTGADISAVCREAALAALEEDLSATGVKQHHFDAALRTVGPSISPHDEAFYSSFQRG